MRNRAKCKLCGDVIESMHATDYQMCRCGEITVYDGDALRCASRNWDNFARVDDDGKEIPVKIQESPAAIPEQISAPPTREELISMLDEMVKTYETLPQNAMTSPITHYDLLSVLLLVSALFKAAD